MRRIRNGPVNSPLSTKTTCTSYKITNNIHIIHIWINKMFPVFCVFVFSLPTIITGNSKEEMYIK